MNLAFFLNRLNHHQACVADCLYTLLGNDYKFIELCEPNEESKKGDNTDYSSRPYLIQAWKGARQQDLAYRIALSADACIFGTEASLPYQRLRLKHNKLSFDVSERWLKRGIVNILSPRLLKNMWYYYTEAWYNKPLYKLCSSAFASGDHARLGMYKNKCFRWGYFTSVETDEVGTKLATPTSDIISLMWCSRFLKWKHPELPILMANRLKKKGYKFHLDMYGSGECEKVSKKLTEILELMDVVSFHGNITNNKVHEAMRKSDIFLFTSDRNEGWGAVANESLSEECVLVASDSIGSTPYLVDDGNNGFIFRSPKTSSTFDKPDVEALASLCEKVEWLLDHPKDLKRMQLNAHNIMNYIWSPAIAANSLIILINDLMNNRPSSILRGPCSKV